MEFDNEVLEALAHLDHAPTPPTIVKMSPILPSSKSSPPASHARGKLNDSSDEDMAPYDGDSNSLLSANFAVENTLTLFEPSKNLPCANKPSTLFIQMQLPAVPFHKLLSAAPFLQSQLHSTESELLLQEVFKVYFTTHVVKIKSARSPGARGGPRSRRAPLAVRQSPYGKFSTKRFVLSFFWAELGAGWVEPQLEFFERNWGSTRFF